MLYVCCITHTHCIPLYSQLTAELYVFVFFLNLITFELWVSVVCVYKDKDTTCGMKMNMKTFNENTRDYSRFVAERLAEPPPLSPHLTPPSRAHTLAYRYAVTSCKGGTARTHAPCRASCAPQMERQPSSYTYN